MPTATDEILKHSVTKDETEYYRAANIFLPLFHYSQPVSMLPELDSVNHWQKDAILTSTLRSERKWWASGVHTTISQVASTSWQVKGTPEIRAIRGQELLHTANGGHGYIEFASRVILDYLTTNNGCFIEKVHVTRAGISKLIGLMHLSSHRCRLTGNPDAPVIYMDVLGQEHEMKAHQVIFTSDLSGYGDGMGGFGANTLGFGMCAAERCYDAIRLQQAIEGFIYGRITGTKTNALDFVQGIMPKQIEAAVASAEADRLMKGNIYYKGVTLIASAGEQKLEHLRVNFAEMPNGFDRETETKLNLMSMALALGLDFQDLYPQAVSGGLNTSSQSQKLHEAARGKGLAMFEKWFAWVINTLVLPENVTFVLSERDYRDEEIQAGVSKARTDVVATQIDKQIITPEQGKQILVDMNELPSWVQPKDLTNSETLDDTEKPELEKPDAEGQPPAQESQAAEGQSADQQQQPDKEAKAKAIAQVTTKKENNGSKGSRAQVVDIPAILDEEIAAARKLFEGIVNRDSENSKKEKEGGQPTPAQDRQVKEYLSATRYTEITTKEAAEAAIASGVRLPVDVLRVWPGLDMKRRRELREGVKVA